MGYICKITSTWHAINRFACMHNTRLESERNSHQFLTHISRLDCCFLDSVQTPLSGSYLEMWNLSSESAYRVDSAFP